MGRSSVYSPALSRLTVKALYHEAKARGTRMTGLADRPPRQDRTR